MIARVALVVRHRSLTNQQRALERAFWSAMSHQHVHDFALTSLAGVFACLECGTTVRRLP